MRTYAVWKNNEVIGYIELTEDQVLKLNTMSGNELYFGYDKVTNPERYSAE